MDERIIEGIEACRPGSDDLFAPEMAEVRAAVERDSAAAKAYRRVQRWDGAAAALLDDVTVPAGLADRILASFDGASNSAAIPAQHSAPAVPSIHFRPRPWRRRWMAWSTAAIAASALAVIVASDVWRPAREVPWEELADRWLESLDPAPTAWRQADQAPREFQVPAEIVATTEGWQPIGKLKHAVAFRLARGGGATAMLYVVRGADSTLPAAPPAAPQSTTGGKAVGYWHRGGLTYILVVPGDARSYRQFVRATTTPLA